MQERPAFQDLARQQLPWLYSHARRLSGSGADDVVQETLVKAFRNYDDLRDPVAAPAWFRTILLNCVRDHFRRESAGPDEMPVEDISDYSGRRTGGEVDQSPYSETLLDLEFLRLFSEDDVWKVLDRLKPMYRVPLVLVHMETIPTRQVARMLGVPLNTVLSWLHRGRKLFEREMWQYATENDLVGESGRR